MNTNLLYSLLVYDNASQEVVYSMKSCLSSDVVRWVHDTLYSFDPYDNSLDDAEQAMLNQDLVFFDVPTIMNELYNFNFRGGLMTYSLTLPGRRHRIVIDEVQSN